MILRLIIGAVVLSLILFLNFQFGFSRVGVVLSDDQKATELAMQDQLFQLQTFIRESYEKNQDYPMYEEVKRAYELQSSQEGYSTTFEIYRYAVLHSIKNSGIYYSVSPNQDLFSLRGFVPGDFLSIFPVLVSVEIPDKDPGFLE